MAIGWEICWETDGAYLLLETMGEYVKDIHNIIVLKMLGDTYLFGALPLNKQLSFTDSTPTLFFKENEYVVDNCGFSTS